MQRPISRRQFLKGATESIVGVSMLGMADLAGSSTASANTLSKRTLTVWDWNYFPSNMGAYLRGLDRKFEAANPGVTINHVGVNYSTAPATFRAAIAARRGPDIITLFPGAYAASYRNGLQPLQHRLTAGQRSQWETLSSSISPDGNLYMIPYTAYSYVFVYNKKLFAKAGIPGPPKTWAAFLSACKALKKANITPISAGFKDGYYAEGFLYMWGDQLLTQKQANSWLRLDLPVSNSGFQSALELLVELDKLGYLTPNSESLTYYNDLRNYFASGKAGWFLSP